ncbi:hypothetical protein BGW80DRAFT_693002 [Lactifluus volemus]|nr:hypothetical protein BGW80DRAFT_693002 [Lactifluus volemus]
MRSRESSTQCLTLMLRIPVTASPREVSGSCQLLTIFQLSSSRIQTFVTTPCKDIIKDMGSLFRGFYLHVNDESTSLQATRKEQDPRVESVHERKLQTSDTLLAILDKHLQSEWDINNGSLDLSEPHTDVSGSRSRRKRKVEDSPDGSEQNIHLRRIGRMPPRSSIRRSIDGHSSQTSSHHDVIPEDAYFEWWPLLQQPEAEE